MTTVELERVALANLATLYRVAKRLASSSDAAEDLVGATLLAAFRVPEQCDGRYPLAWLIQILRNCHLQERRRSSSLPPSEVNWDHVADSRAHHLLFDRLAEVDVLRALDLLPEEYRLALVLCVMEDMDYAEAALAVQVPIGTIRSRVSRGRKMLQNLLLSEGTPL